MLALLLTACGPSEDPGTVPPDPTTTTTPPTTDTGTPPTGPDDTAPPTTGYGEPTALTVTCAATTNPLRYTCDVTVEPPQPVELTWSRVDGLGPARSRASDAAAGTHTLDVLFLAPLQEYALEAIAVAWPDGLAGTTSFTTDQPPLAVASRLQATGASTLGLIGTESPCDTGAWAVIYDTSTGDLVWFHNLDLQGELGMLDMVRFTDAQTVIGETDGNVVEIDLLGNDLARFPVDYPGCCSLNHDIFLDDDDLFWSQFQNTQAGLTVDNIVVIDRYGVEQYQWDPRDHLDLPPGASGDYLHTNSEYVDSDGDFYLSWLTRDSVGKFEGDRGSPDWGEPVWLMTGDGQQGDLGNDITLDWTGISPPHEFGGQHNFHGRRDGRLMLLDNDNGRGLVIDVDEATLTGTVEAEYPTHESQCFAQGTAMDAVSGNAVVACASEWVREYDLATSTLLWEAEIVCVNNGGGGFTPGSATRWYPLDGWE